MILTKELTTVLRPLAGWYMYLVAALGGLCVTYSVATFPIQKLDLNLAVLVALTLGLGTRITLPIPRFNSHISVSDTLIFLTLLLYGGEAAIILAAVEAFISARRFCSQQITVLFNSGTLAVSTTAVAILLWAYGLYSVDQLHGRPGKMAEFLTALSVMAVTQFLFNTILTATCDALRNGLPLWETWKSKYVMSFPTYLVGAAGAGALVRLVDVGGFAVMFAAVPIIGFVFLAYRMHLRNVAMSIDQADKAHEYAKAMKERTVALRDSEERFRRAFDHAPIGIAMVSTDGKWLKTNRALSRILGYSPKEFRKMSFHSIIFEDDLGRTLSKLNDVQAGRLDGCEMEQRYLHKDGSTVWASWSASIAGHAGESGNSLIFQLQDITEKKFAEEKLQHEASHDSLTGLPNRAHFMKRLDRALRKVRENPKYRVSVLFIDLDRFKYVNDSLGHFIGDELLCAIANRLNSSMRPPDMVARLGGDEFVILVEGRYYSEKTTRIAERIQKKISTPFKLQGHEVFTSASIGILNVSEQHMTSEDVIRDADTAMYQAKRTGKARHEIFDDDMRAAVRETLQLETDLRRAIHDGDLTVHYQPIFSLVDEKLYAVEALARWEHPRLGTVSPERFVPLAEEIGLIDDLTEHILRKACTHISSLRRQHPELEDMKLSVNVSSKQFGNENIIERVGSILEESQFPADRLKLEITETVFFEDHDRALDTLRRLRETGIETDIDDFGTGYSNLAYLVRLPISTLKIDRSFVMLMAENPANREVIRTIILLAANLGFRVIAEGIESEHQREVLKNLGCDYGQGYLFSRPLGPELLGDFLLGRREGEYIVPPAMDLSEASMIQ
ncbi:MAG: EAL domain-containing protein [bacterium]|nr:EAL domain-containing protein [bacterium]